MARSNPAENENITVVAAVLGFLVTVAGLAMKVLQAKTEHDNRKKE